MAAVLNGASHSRPTARLQIKYVSHHHPRSPSPSPFFSSLRTRSTSPETPPFTATITEDTQSQSWQITTVIRDASSQSQCQAIEIYTWPMFSPEETQLIATAETSSPIAPAQAGSVVVEVPKRKLARFNERSSKWVLEEGIYMFEIKTAESLGAGMGMGMGIVKQVSVVGHVEWAE